MFSDSEPSSAPVPGVTGLGYSGMNNPQWDRGANLQDYYSRKEEQDAKAVCPLFEYFSNMNKWVGWGGTLYHIEYTYEFDIYIYVS